MSLLRELITENPMLIEMQRFRRRFFSPNSTQNRVVVFILVIIYLFLLGAVVSYEIDYKMISQFMLLVVVVVAPITLHSAIAGERERQSWDMLLVAPVSKPQIVVGKFIGGLLGLLTIVAALAVPLLISDYSRMGNLPSGETRFSTGGTIIAIIASFGLMVAAFTMLVSARSRRSITVLGIVYGTLFIVLAVVPILMSITFRNFQDAETGMYLNPFYAVSQVDEHVNQSIYEDASWATSPRPTVQQHSHFEFGLVHVFLYLATALICLAFASNVLNSAGWEDPSLSRSTNARS